MTGEQILTKYETVIPLTTALNVLDRTGWNKIPEQGDVHENVVQIHKPCARFSASAVCHLF